MVTDHSNITEVLSKLLNRLNEISARDFAGLADAQLQWKPSPESWSIVECLQHLILLFEMHLPKIEQAIDKGRPDKILDGKTAFRSGLLGKYLIKSVRLKEDNSFYRFSKSPKKLQPKQNIEGALSIVLNNYFQYSEQLLQLLSKAKYLHLEETKVVLHLFLPFRLRLGDMLQYLVYHIERHIVQAQKVYSELGFPRAVHTMF